MADVIQGLTMYIKELDENSRKGVQKACRIIKDKAVNNAPSVSGQLRQSIKYRTKEDGKEIIGEVYTGLEYAPYVHEGTGKFAKKGNGRKTGWKYTVKGKTYWSQGQKPNPFLEKAVEETKGRILNIIGGELL